MYQPWQLAKKWHLEIGSTVSFEQLLGMYMNSGYVWSSPTEFVLGRQVRLEDGAITHGEPNAWFVHLAAGEEPFKRFLELAPNKQEYVCWNRRGKEKLHIYKWNTFKRRLENGN